MCGVDFWSPNMKTLWVHKPICAHVHKIRLESETLPSLVESTIFLLLLLLLACSLYWLDILWKIYIERVSQRISSSDSMFGS